VYELACSGLKRHEIGSLKYDPTHLTWSEDALGLSSSLQLFTWNLATIIPADLRSQLWQHHDSSLSWGHVYEGVPMSVPDPVVHHLTVRSGRVQPCMWWTSLHCIQSIDIFPNYPPHVMRTSPGFQRSRTPGFRSERLIRPQHRGTFARWTTSLDRHGISTAIFHVNHPPSSYPSSKSCSKRI